MFLPDQGVPYTCTYMYVLIFSVPVRLDRSRMTTAAYPLTPSPREGVLSFLNWFFVQTLKVVASIVVTFFRFLNFTQHYYPIQTIFGHNIALSFL